MGKLSSASLFILASASIALGQTGLNCVGTAVTPIVRAEGIAERFGDIVLNCSGAAAANFVGGNLNIFLDVPVTNKLTPDGNADVILTVDSGSGPASVGVPARIVGSNQVAFNGINVTLPSSGQVAFRISNLRGNVNSISTAQLPQITARLSFTAGQFISIPNNVFSIGVTQPGLRATVLSNLIGRQQGSPLPENISFTGFINAHTHFASVRATEGAVNAFERRQPMSDQGTRIVLRYSNLPATARLFVPDFIAGSNATRPTAAGDFGGTVSGGQYTQAGALLLARVRNTDANGAGGQLVGTVVSTDVFNAMSEVDLAGGSGIAVYEVLDSNISALESAQIPTFLTIPPVGDAGIVQVKTEVFLGPISTVVTPSQTAPVPRFAAVAPELDCVVLNDCNASYLPRLGVDFPVIDVTLAQGSPYIVRYGRAFNNGGNVLIWDANIVYSNGSNWVTVSPSSGIGQATLRLDITPGMLTPGVYAATLLVDAGQNAGTARVPIRLTVTPPTTSRPHISAVVNAATFRATPLVRGSYGTILGSSFGSTPQVSVDNVPGTVSFSNGQQINFIVPATLTPRNAAQVVVTSGTERSQPFTITLADASPAIFPSILNQDNSVNSATSPALAGSIIQIFATGVASPETNPLAVTVRIQDRDNLTPIYAGPAPGIPGVQQINVQVPADLPAATTEVQICSTVTQGRICSAPVRLDIRR